MKFIRLRLIIYAYVENTMKIIVMLHFSHPSSLGKHKTIFCFCIFLLLFVVEYYFKDLHSAVTVERTLLQNFGQVAYYLRLAKRNLQKTFKIMVYSD